VLLILDYFDIFSRLKLREARMPLSPQGLAIVAGTTSGILLIVAKLVLFSALATLISTPLCILLIYIFL
jgi:hypothetical protein